MRCECQQRHARKLLAQQRHQLGAVAGARGQGQVDDGYIHPGVPQAVDEIVAVGMAGDDGEAAVAGKMEGGAATDDFVVIQKRQLQGARCRKSIHAQEVIGARRRGDHSGAAVASNIEIVGFLRLFLEIDGLHPSMSCESLT